MFRRRPPAAPEPSAEGPRDADLPMLSAAQAAALNALACEAFARHGTVVRPDGTGAVVGERGTVYGLHNLAVGLAGTPFRDWPRAVDQHARSMLAAERPQTAGPDAWYLRVRAFADLEQPPDFDATSPLPGIAALPALDFPTHVEELFGAQQVAALADPDVFRERAFANLRALALPERTVLHADEDRSDADVHVFAADDFFGASRVLVLDHVLASTLRLERPVHGVVVAIPNRHLLVVHPVTGIGVVAALQLVVRIAEGEYSSRPGPVSVDVFHLPGGGGLGQRLTERDGDGVRVVVDGPFAEVLTALGEPPD